MADISPFLADRLLPMSDATSTLLAEERRLYENDRLHVSVTWDKLDGEKPTRKFSMRVSSASENPASLFARNSWYYRVPGCVLRANGTFEAPITDTTVLVCLAMWGPKRIEFDGDEEAELEFKVKLAQFFQNQKIAEYVARFKETKEVPDHFPTGNPERPPMPQQRIAAQCLLDCAEAHNLFMEMRTGKTYSAIMAMDKDCEKNPGVMNLVICPKNVRTAWEAEIKACTTKRVNVITLRRSKIKRMKAILEAFEFRKDYDYTVVIVSYDGLTRTITPLASMRWRWGFADEGHYFKQSRTERWKAMMKLRPSCEKRSSLTGTPICNSAMDLYTQFEWLGEAYSGFQSFTDFCNFYGVLKKIKRRKGGYDKILIGMQNVPLLQERLARTGFFASKKEVLPNLPPITFKTLDVEMTDYQRDVYKQVALQIKAEIESQLDGEERTITVNNILTKLLRLAQITSGYMAIDGEVDCDTGDVISREIDRFDPNPKLDDLVEYLNEKRDAQVDGEPVGKTIVWAAFVENIKQIRARLEMEGYKVVTFYGKTSETDRELAVHEFNNNPDVTVFIGNPQAGGVGIKLNGRCDDANGKRRAQADSMVYYSQGWSAPVRIQSQARPQDMKCEWPIEVVDLCVFNTIDFEIRDRVLGKIQHAMAIQDIRQLLKRLIPE